MIFVVVGRSGDRRNTVPNMIGAKIAPRLSVRPHDGACGSRSKRDVLCLAVLSAGGAVRLDLVAVVVDPHVVVALPLRAPPLLLLRRHRDDDYADPPQATFPSAITVCTTGPPR